MDKPKTQRGKKWRATHFAITAQFGSETYCGLMVDDKIKVTELESK